MNKKKTRINLLLEIILWLVSIVTIYPMLMVLLTSFKNKGEAAYMNISLPSEWHPENYIAVLEKDFMRSLGNSVFITFISVALIVSLSAFLSFIIVRRDTKGCRIGYKIITLGIIAPFAALPTIQLMQKMGIYGSRIGLCFVYSSLYMPFTTMMFSGFIKGIPKELDEAAVMDGAVGGRLFCTVILPLLKPVLATTSDSDVPFEFFIQMDIASFCIQFLRTVQQKLESCMCRCCTGFPAGDPSIHFCAEVGDCRYDSRCSKGLITLRYSFCL